MQLRSSEESSSLALPEIATTIKAAFTDIIYQISLIPAIQTIPCSEMSQARPGKPGLKSPS
jgi:hypothetical protein